MTPSTPQESGCDLGRKSPGKNSGRDGLPGPRQPQFSPDPQQLRSGGGRRQERRSREGPGRGAWETGCPGLRLSRTCPELAPAETGPTPEPLRPDPFDWPHGTVAGMPAFPGLGLGPKPPEDWSSRRAEDD